MREADSRGAFRRYRFCRKTTLTKHIARVHPSLNAAQQKAAHGLNGSPSPKAIPKPRPVTAASLQKLSTTSVDKLRSTAAPRQGRLTKSAGRYATRATSIATPFSPTKKAGGFHPYRPPTSRLLDKEAKAARFGSSALHASADAAQAHDAEGAISYIHVRAAEPSPELESEDEDYAFAEVSDHLQEPMSDLPQSTATAVASTASPTVGADEMHFVDAVTAAGDNVCRSTDPVPHKMGVVNQPIPRRSISVCAHGGSGRSFSNPVRTTTDADEASVRETWLADITAHDRSTAGNPALHRAQSNPSTPIRRDHRVGGWDTGSESGDDDEVDGSPIARTLPHVYPPLPPSMSASQTHPTANPTYRTPLEHSATYSFSGALSPAPSATTADAYENKNSRTQPDGPLSPYEPESPESPDSTHSSGPSSPTSYGSPLPAIDDLTTEGNEEPSRYIETRPHLPPVGSAAHGYYVDPHSGLQYAYGDGHGDDQRAAYYASVQSHHMHLRQQQQEYCHQQQGAHQPAYPASPYARYAAYGLSSQECAPAAARHHLAIPTGYYAATYPPSGSNSYHPSWTYPRSASFLPTPVEPSTPIGRMPYWSSSAAAHRQVGYGRTIPIEEGPVTSSFYARSIDRQPPAHHQSIYAHDDEQEAYRAVAAAANAAADEKAASEAYGYRFLRSPELSAQQLPHPSTSSGVGLGLGVEMDREDRIQWAKDVEMIGF